MWVLAAVAAKGSGVSDSQITLGVVVLIALAVLGYGFSLVAHPYTACRTCHGGSRHSGMVFGYAFRACRSCGGSGRKMRWGVRVFRGGATNGS